MFSGRASQFSIYVYKRTEGRQSTVKYKAIVLAAGVGVRLRPLSVRVPKVLLNVGGSPIIASTLHALAVNEITNICVVVGYQASAIMGYLSEAFPYPRFNISYVYNQRHRNTNTAYSLWLASSSLSGSDVIIVNGDLLVVPEAVERLMKCSGPCLGVRIGSCGDEEVKIKLLGGRITYLGKHLPPAAADGEYIGIAKLDGRMGERFQSVLEMSVRGRGGNTLYYDDVIQKLLRSYCVKGIDLTDLPMVEIDTHEDLKQARRVYSERGRRK